MSTIEEIQNEIRELKKENTKLEEEINQYQNQHNIATTEPVLAFLTVTRKKIVANQDTINTLYNKLPNLEPAVARGVKNRLSHGSISRGSANNAQQIETMLDTYICDKNAKVYFGLDEEYKGFLLDKLPVITESDMVKLAEVSSMPKNTKRIELEGNNENALQACLTSNCKTLKAVDTHKSIGNAVEFMLPRQFGKKVIYTNTGKADMTSSVRRMIFEVKSKGQENALIVQMLERLVTSMDISHMLKNSIVFGATPERAFIFISTREIPLNRSSSNALSFHLFAVRKAEVFRMWQLASNTKGPSSFLTDDAPLLLSSLQALSIDPWICRVHLLDWSQHRVYDITLPEMVQWPKANKLSPDEDWESGKTCVGVACDSPTFAMKVVCSNDAFRREAMVLHKIGPSFFICSVGSSRKTNGDLSGVVTDASFNIHNVRAKALNSARKGEGWWRSQNRGRAQGGGVLVMRVGESKFDLENEDDEQDTHAWRCAVVNDCLASIELMHSAGYCHTDLRRPNLLQFDQKYVPIDFGDAVKIGEEVSVDEFSEGRKNLVTAAARCTPGSTICWGKEHDVEMLFRAVFDIPVSSNSLEKLEGVNSRKRIKRRKLNH